MSLHLGKQRVSQIFSLSLGESEARGRAGVREAVRHNNTLAAAYRPSLTLIPSDEATSHLTKLQKRSKSLVIPEGEGS